jgi:hypothetical protein
MKVQHRLSEERGFRFFRRLGSNTLVSAIAGLALVLFCGDSAAGQAVTNRTFDITSDVNFQNYRDVLGRFARKHRPKASNDFCVVGYVAADSSRLAWVIWRQGGEIILWEGQESDPDSSRRRINLGRDVVKTDSDVRGSTYLVTRAWVADLTAACNRAGTKLHLEKPKKTGRH